MLLTIFTISFVLCALMIGLRLLEIKRQKAFATTTLLNKVDTVVQGRVSELKALGLKKKQEVIFFVTHHVPFYVWNQARDMTSGMRKHYAKIERTVRGRNMIKQTGEASDFIKNISEGKHKSE